MKENDNKDGLLTTEFEQCRVNKYVNYASTKGRYASSVSKYQIPGVIKKILTYLSTISSRKL